MDNDIYEIKGKLESLSKDTNKCLKYIIDELFVVIVLLIFLIIKLSK